MKKLIPVLIFGALLVPGAQGSITTYTTRSTFESALATPTTFDFDQANGPVSTLGSLLGVSTIGGDPNGQIFGNSLFGSLTDNVESFLPVQFSFLTNGFAFGYDNLDLTADEEAVITISYASGPSDVFTVSLGGQDDFTPVFFGAISTDAISNVQVYSRTIGEDTIGDRQNIIDNVTVDAGPITATPEPSSLMLMSGGLLILLGRSSSLGSALRRSLALLRN